MSFSTCQTPHFESRITVRSKANALHMLTVVMEFDHNEPGINMPVINMPVIIGLELALFFIVDAESKSQ